MSDRIKNIVVTILFMTVLIGVLIINITKPQKDISISERRKLTKFPEMSITKFLDGSFNKEFELFTTDQMVKRDELRTLKALTEFNLFKKKDNNNMYMKDGSIIKIEYPLNEKAILNATTKMQWIKENYLKDCKVYYSIIPDKNFFSGNEFIHMDYSKLQELMKQNLEGMEYINIFNKLQLKDYYVTDIHWKQENIGYVVNEIAFKMKFKDRLTSTYQTEKIIAFEGVYANQIPLETEEDTIMIVKNDIIENAIVFNFETQTESKVYNMEKKKSNDKYDIYLSGPTTLLKITNPNATTDKELIIFRDSFGSSLAPYFIEAYKTITLIDIRYIASKYIENYVEFSNQDVLFIYSTQVLNTLNIFK